MTDANEAAPVLEILGVTMNDSTAVEFRRPKKRGHVNVHAMMATRIEPRDSLDDFPTPPWATRALVQHVIGDNWRNYTCLEPACGRGDMARTLEEYFKEVRASDIHAYGQMGLRDFLSGQSIEQADWVITNPPFRLLEPFVLRAMQVAKVGIAMLARTSAIEGVGRYNRIFRQRPPTRVAQFVERLPMVKGRLDPNITTATSYCWLIWQRYGARAGTELVWIPPCRRALERPGDYDDYQCTAS